MPFPRRNTTQRHAFGEVAWQPTKKPAVVPPTRRPRSSCGVGRLAAGLVAAALPFSLAGALFVASTNVSVPLPRLAVTSLLQDGGEFAYPLPPIEPAADRPSHTPRTVEELLALEAVTLATAEKIVPTTVGLLIGGGQGSGVIVSPDGLILTAGHVSGQPNQRCQVILSDGTTLSGRTLGRIGSLDAGMAVIDDPNAPDPLPFAPISTSGDIEVGTWTVATGHPGGYEVDRPPVVRVGRVNVSQEDLLQSDNTLVGGDSGGPLFDLNGHVIGIHSRIGDSMSANVHVPIDQYVANWDKLSSGVDEGGFNLPGWMMPDLADDGIRLELGGNGDLGGVDGGGDFRSDDGRVGATVHAVVDGSPADEAGIRAGDRIVRVAGFDIASEGDMLMRRTLFRKGITLDYTVIRDGEELSFELSPADPQGDPQEDPMQGPAYRGILGVGGPTPLAGQGVGVGSVDDRGPAFAAGIRPGHAITAVRGVRVNSWPELIRLMRPLRGGDTVAVSFVDDQGRQRTVSITLAARGDLQP